MTFLLVHAQRSKLFFAIFIFFSYLFAAVVHLLLGLLPVQEFSRKHFIFILRDDEDALRNNMKKLKSNFCGIPDVFDLALDRFPTKKDSSFEQFGHVIKAESKQRRLDYSEICKFLSGLHLSRQLL